jgi:hypothetical protein
MPGSRFFTNAASNAIAFASQSSAIANSLSRIVAVAVWAAISLSDEAFARHALELSNFDFFPTIPNEVLKSGIVPETSLTGQGHLGYHTKMSVPVPRCRCVLNALKTAYFAGPSSMFTQI